MNIFHVDVRRIDMDDDACTLRYWNAKTFDKDTYNITLKLTTDKFESI